MDWFFKIIRIAGVNFPVAASFVQLQAELGSTEMVRRLENLEDPISNLHEDIPKLAKIIYAKLIKCDSVNLNFPDKFYINFSRPLAALESAGFISKKSVIGSRVPLGIKLTDPSFIMYMCNLAECQHKMQKIVEIVERCEVGLWLNGDELKESLDLPKYVIRAIFEIYESKGFGILSREVGSCNYMGKA